MHDFYRPTYGPDANRLPEVYWPGCYPLFYVAEDSSILCPDCANIAEESSPDNIIKQQANYENPELFCDQCNAKIESVRSRRMKPTRPKRKLPNRLHSVSD